MDEKRLARGATTTARYVVAAGAAVAFLTLLIALMCACMLLVGVLAYGDMGGPLFVFTVPLFALLYAVVGVAGALPVCIVGEVVLGERLARRACLVVPTIALVVILSVTVGTILLGGVFRVRPGSGTTAPLQWTFDISSVAMMFLVPPLTYWILLQGARRLVEALAERFDHLSPYMKKGSVGREAIQAAGPTGREDAKDARQGNAVAN